MYLGSYKRSLKAEDIALEATLEPVFIEEKKETVSLFSRFKRNKKTASAETTVAETTAPEVVATEATPEKEVVYVDRVIEKEVVKEVPVYVDRVVEKEVIREVPVSESSFFGDYIPEDWEKDSTEDTTKETIKEEQEV